MLIFLNFSDSQQALSVPFPIAGTYREMLDDDVRGTNHLEIKISSSGQFQQVQIPANYGQIYVTPVLPVLKPPAA